MARFKLFYCKNHNKRFEIKIIDLYNNITSKDKNIKVTTCSLTYVCLHIRNKTAVQAVKEYICAQG